MICEDGCLTTESGEKVTSDDQSLLTTSRDSAFTGIKKSHYSHNILQNILKTGTTGSNDEFRFINNSVVMETKIILMANSFFFAELMSHGISKFDPFLIEGSTPEEFTQLLEVREMNI